MRISARGTRLVCVLAALLCGAVAARAQDPVWYPAPNVSNYGVGAISLQDSRILLVDGSSYQTELLDGALNVTPTGPSTIGGRAYPAMAMLGDGHVFSAGGIWNYGWGNYFPTNAAEVFDPVSNAWTAANPMHYARYGSQAVQMADGRLMVAGGDSYSGYYVSNIVEIYDPGTGSWTIAASMKTDRRNYPGSSNFFLFALSNGKVMAIGGTSWNAFDPEIYDPGTDTWTPTPAPDWGGAVSAAKLPDGRILVTGGLRYDSSTYAQTLLTTARIYDPQQDSWSVMAPMPIGHANDQSLVLPDGRVLVSGGYNYDSTTYTEDLRSQYYDPVSNTWTIGAPMSEPYGYATGLFAISGGKVLAMEDWGSELLRLLRPPSAVEQSIVSSGAPNVLTLVTLDASASTDPDADALVNFTWTEDGTVLASSSSAVVQVGLGVATHTITLTVTDATGMSGATTFTVTVQDPSVFLAQQLAACSTTVSGDTAAIAALQAQLTALQQNIGTALGVPTFTIPGSTPAQQMQNLETALAGLNPGQKRAIYDNLVPKNPKK